MKSALLTHFKYYKFGRILRLTFVHIAYGISGLSESVPLK